MSAFAARKLGKSGIEVSALGMGCWAIGGPWTFAGSPAGWGEVDDAESIRAIHAALEGGINFFDTAANYGTGHSERVLGEALKGKREKAVLATKFGFVVDEKTRQVSRFPEPKDVIQNVRTACEESLRRLGTDCIDLYQLHVGNYPVEHAAELRAVLEALVAEGKIRWYGWSTDSAERASHFADGEHCAAIQHDLNVVADAPEMLALCAKHHLASVNRSPLAQGALTGKYDAKSAFAKNDVRTDSSLMDNYFKPALQDLEKVRGILTGGGRSLAQGALAWILTRSPLTVPIPGFRDTAQVKENIGALEFGPLTQEQMQEIGHLLGRR